MYTFLCILLLLSDICFFNMYYLWSYSNASDKTLLGGIWIILALWWGCHRLTEGWIGVLNKLRFSWVFWRTSRSCVPQVWSLEHQLVVWIIRLPTHKTSVQNVHPGSGDWDSFPGVKWPGSEDNYSPPSSAKFEDKWIYTSTPLCCHCVYCTLLYHVTWYSYHYLAMFHSRLQHICLLLQPNSKFSMFWNLSYIMKEPA